MSIKQLEAFMGTHHAGTVSRLSGGKLAFDYDPRYADLPSATPVSVSMPSRSHRTRTATSHRGFGAFSPTTTQS